MYVIMWNCRYQLESIHKDTAHFVIVRNIFTVFLTNFSESYDNIRSAGNTP